jgi:hypothetical protein
MSRTEAVVARPIQLLIAHLDMVAAAQTLANFGGRSDRVWIVKTPLGMTGVDAALAPRPEGKAT